jgi:hypothetical protein
MEGGLSNRGASPRLTLLGALLGALAAAPLAWYLRGFTVDDALIPARYAHHLARGLGYRFNVHGPSTDGVTPLGFAHLLSPFAHASVLSAWSASRVLGRFAWFASAAALGAAITRLESGGARKPLGARHASLLLVLCSAPLGAWASAGLETPWVVLLATIAAVLPPRPAYALAGAAAAGLGAWLRPEMLPFAFVLGIARARTASSARARRACVALAMLPWLGTAAARAAMFGRPAPLAVFAKPSDLAHGLRYVVPALLFAGAPLVALAPGAWRRLPSWPRWLIIAGFAHLGVVALAGGDWMPLARLVCPVLPAFVLVSAHLLDLDRASARWWAAGRLTCACAAEVAVLATRGAAAQRVAGDRLALIASARPLLTSAVTVATVDVGWVGAATEADVVDLAGATDPEIAALPGGHTSKAVSGAFLLARHPDWLILAVERNDVASSELVLPAPAGGAGLEAASLPYSRIVEQRIATDGAVARQYRAVWRSPPELPLSYVALARTDPRAEQGQPP